MIRAARQAPDLLGDATGHLVEFLREQFHADGGAVDRSGKPDLYYTVFLLDALAALCIEDGAQSSLTYLGAFGDGTGLDLIHHACLARCWAAMPAGTLDETAAQNMLANIETHRSADGGYHETLGSDSGTVYHCYMALGAYQDLRAEFPNPEGLQRCVAGLRLEDGGYCNDPDVQIGITPVTAAAIVMLRHFDEPVPKTTTDWLLAQCTGNGGFLAAPGTPFPDLLSTATALHALAMSDVALSGIREPCLDFVEGLWTGRAFRGHWSDDDLDSEYAFYALLALGHLSAIP